MFNEKLARLSEHHDIRKLDRDEDDDARSSRLSQNVLYKNRDANVVRFDLII